MGNYVSEFAIGNEVYVIKDRENRETTKTISEKMNTYISDSSEKINGNTTSIERLDKRQTASENNIENLQTETINIKNGLNNLSENYYRNLKTPKVLIIGDSLGSGDIAGGTQRSYVDFMKSIYKGNITNFSRGGYGFRREKTSNFYSLLDSTPTDYYDVIIFQSLTNDVVNVSGGWSPYTDFSSLTSDVSATITKCSTKYPNSKIILMALGSWNSSAFLSAYNTAKECYYMGCGCYAQFIDATITFQDHSALVDGIHPTEAQANIMGRILTSCLWGGEVDRIYKKSVSVNKNSGITGSIEIYAYRDKSGCYVNIEGNISGNFKTDGSLIFFGTIPKTIFVAPLDNGTKSRFQGSCIGNTALGAMHPTMMLSITELNGNLSLVGLFNAIGHDFQQLNLTSAQFSLSNFFPNNFC